MNKSFLSLSVIISENNDSILMPQHLNGTMHGGHMTNTTGGETFDDDTVSPQVIAWCCFAAVFFCVCMNKRAWDPSYRSSLAERERRIRRAQAKKDPAQRKLVINKSLITKVTNWCQPIQCCSFHCASAYLLLCVFTECD